MTPTPKDIAAAIIKNWNTEGGGNILDYDPDGAIADLESRIATAIDEAEIRGSEEMRETAMAAVREVLEENLAEKAAAILARIRKRAAPLRQEEKA